jgi:hypothetical protein
VTHGYVRVCGRSWVLHEDDLTEEVWGLLAPPKGSAFRAVFLLSHFPPSFEVSQHNLPVRPRTLLGRARLQSHWPQSFHKARRSGQRA